jgi:hypothetical protein
MPRKLVGVVVVVGMVAGLAELPDKVFRAELHQAAVQTGTQLAVVVVLEGPVVLIPHNSLVMAVLGEGRLLQELGSSTVAVVEVAYTDQVQMQDLVEEDLVVVATVTALLDLIQEHKMVNLIQVVVAVQVEIPADRHRMVVEVAAEL